MDDCDLAQKFYDQFLARSLSAALRDRSGERVSLTHCIDCGEPIPEMRREKAPGCTRCTGCQAEFERTGG